VKSILASTLLSGTVATVATTAILAGLAALRGHSPVLTTNATSHWFHGESAAGVVAHDLRHTATGFATHWAASLFWAAVFQGLRRLGPRRRPLSDALGVSAVAAAVDYGIVPKRLTPGWEMVVGPVSIGITYGVMAFALAATASRSGNDRCDP
jgi:hypothetical protein